MAQTVFLCLLGLLFGWQSVEAKSCYPDLAQAALAGVLDGPFLSGTTLEALTFGDGYRVTCALQVENWTRYNLSNPVIHMNHGQISKAPPATIDSGYREVTVTRKTSGTATGTSGTVSWEVEGLDRRVYLMWSAPFNFDFYSNWLGVGVSAPGYTGHPGGDDLFEQMYNHGDSDTIKFERKKFNGDMTPVKFG
ncbi:hypothetical protein V1264_019077 [Littorina saxatilis]